MDIHFTAWCLVCAVVFPPRQDAYVCDRHPPPSVYPDIPLFLRDQVSEGIGKQKDPRQVAQELVSAAREAGSGDDITAVVAKLG